MLPRFGTLLAAALLLAAVPAIAGDPASAPKHYVCTPCNLPCDAKTFDAPGICPDCGMALVEAGSVAAQAVRDPDQKKVAILVFNGVEILDYTGPYEMFGAAGCDVYTVALDKQPVTTAMGMTVVPKYSFTEAPQPDVLVIPGGGVKGAAQSEPTLQYIRDVTAHTQSTMSVCNGAFILANTGLLDGLSATTTNGNIPRLTSQYPKIKVVSDQRFVDNGHIVTAAGLSAGIDGALHVIGKLFGPGYAQEVALSEEYDWHPQGGFVRAALADQQIPDFQLDDLGKWNVVRTEGDRARWDVVVKGSPKVAPSEITAHVKEILTKAKWTEVRSGSAHSPSSTSTWRFTGSDGKPWTGTLKVDGDGVAGNCTAALSIARAL